LETPFIFTLNKGVITYTTLVPDAQLEFLQTVVGAYDIVFYGTITNSDVIQLLTPASIRREHPIATLVGCDMQPRPDLLMIRKLAASLSTAGGSFLFFLISRLEDRAILVCRNAPYKLFTTPEYPTRAFVVGDRKPNNTVYMIGPGSSGIDFVDIPIPIRPASRRLYLTQKYLDTWPQEAGYRSDLDIKITYTQLEYKYVKPPEGPLEITELLCSAIKFAQDLDDLKSIVAGFSSENLDLLTANTLTRLVFVVSDRRIQLELPIYNNRLGFEVRSTS
jgi:hypothetical protein